jgi:hypothetical protein
MNTIKSNTIKWRTSSTNIFYLRTTRNMHTAIRINKFVPRMHGTLFVFLELDQKGGCRYSDPGMLRNGHADLLGHSIGWTSNGVWSEMKFRFNVTDRIGMMWIMMILVNYVMMMHGLWCWWCLIYNVDIQWWCWWYICQFSLAAVHLKMRWSLFWACAMWGPSSVNNTQISHCFDIF